MKEVLTCDCQLRRRVNRVRCCQPRLRWEGVSVWWAKALCCRRCRPVEVPAHKPIWGGRAQFGSHHVWSLIQAYLKPLFVYINHFTANWASMAFSLQKPAGIYGFQPDTFKKFLALYLHGTVWNSAQMKILHQLYLLLLFARTIT